MKLLQVILLCLVINNCAFASEHLTISRAEYNRLKKSQEGENTITHVLLYVAVMSMSFCAICAPYLDQKEVYRNEYFEGYKSGVKTFCVPWPDIDKNYSFRALGIKAGIDATCKKQLMYQQKQLEDRSMRLTTKKGAQTLNPHYHCQREKGSKKNKRNKSHR